MAGNGGARKGAGRKPGVANKANRERQALAERIIAEQQGKPGKKLGREVLEEYMHLFFGMSAIYQPLPPNVLAGPQQNPDEGKFLVYAKFAIECAKEVAQYQSPKMKAVFVNPETIPGMLPSVPMAGEGARLSQLTPQQAYRMLRDQDVIDMPSSAPPAKGKVANG